MSPRPKFFYCHGTHYIIRGLQDAAAALFGPINDLMGRLTNPDGIAEPGVMGAVRGLNGITWPWNNSPPTDPFPDLIDEERWDVEFVQYPANLFQMGFSIDIGIENVKQRIDLMPAGTPWAVGGYSQGAAVVSGVLVEAQSGSLTARYPDFLGGVTFGNPRRKINWRGPVGGTWSGSWDSPGSTTGGGGAFPTTGPWGHLSNPPDTWVDFTAPGEVISSVGTTSIGNGWRQGAGLFLNVTSVADWLAAVPQVGNIIDGIRAAILDVASVENLVIDGLNQPWRIGGAGHTHYAFLPPPDANGVVPSTPVTVTVQKPILGTNATVPVDETFLAPVGQTAYQVALEYLNTLAGEWATVPIVVPEPAPVEPAWGTTLTTPSQVLTAAWSTSLTV